MIDQKQLQRIRDFLANEFGPDQEIVVLVTSQDDRGVLRELICTHDSEDDACEQMLLYLEDTIDDEDAGDPDVESEHIKFEPITRTLQ